MGGTGGDVDDVGEVYSRRRRPPFSGAVAKLAMRVQSPGENVAGSRHRDRMRVARTDCDNVRQRRKRHGTECWFRSRQPELTVSVGAPYPYTAIGAECQAVCAPRGDADDV